MGVCFYFCSSERNSELFSRSRKGSERNSEIFCYRNSVGNNHLSHLFRLPRNYFLSEVSNPSWSGNSSSVCLPLVADKGETVPDPGTVPLCEAGRNVPVDRWKSTIDGRPLVCLVPNLQGEVVHAGTALGGCRDRLERLEGQSMSVALDKHCRCAESSSFGGGRWAAALLCLVEIIWRKFREI